MFAMRKIKQILFVQRGERDAERESERERVKGGKRDVVRKTTQSLQSLRAPHTHTHTVLKSVNGPTTRTTLERSNSNSATAQQQQLLECCLQLLLQLLPVLLLLLQLPFVHPSRLKRHMAFLQNSNKTS